MIGIGFSNNDKSIIEPVVKLNPEKVSSYSQGIPCSITSEFKVPVHIFDETPTEIIGKIRTPNPIIRVFAPPVISPSEPPDSVKSHLVYKSS